MILGERAYPLLNSLVKTTLGLGSNCIITKATKFVRFDWRSLLDYFEQHATGGLEPPYVIIRCGPDEQADWGMQNHCWQTPIEIFVVESERNKIKTKVNGASNTSIVTVDSTIRMFAEQRLFFKTAQEYGLIQSVDSSTQITLYSPITVIDNEDIVSDITSDVAAKVELLKEQFLQGTSLVDDSGTIICQFTEDPLTDVSDMNPANEQQEEDNYSLLAGSVFIKPLFGHTI